MAGPRCQVVRTRDVFLRYVENRLRDVLVLTGIPSCDISPQRFVLAVADMTKCVPNLEVIVQQLEEVGYLYTKGGCQAMERLIKAQIGSPSLCDDSKAERMLKQHLKNVLTPSIGGVITVFIHATAAISQAFTRSEFKRCKQLIRCSLEMLRDEKVQGIVEQDGGWERLRDDSDCGIKAKSKRVKRTSARSRRLVDDRRHHADSNDCYINQSSAGLAIGSFAVLTAIGLHILM